MQDTYTLADLVRATGAKRRSVQLWAERGVINALPGTANAGTGVHREFSRDEAIIACIVAPFALRQMAIGELKNIAWAVRAQLLSDPKMIRAAIGGNGDTLLISESWVFKGELRHQVILGNQMPAPSRKYDSVGMAIRLETYLQKLD